MPKDEWKKARDREGTARRANAAEWAKAAARAKRLTTSKTPAPPSRPPCWVPYEMPFGKHKGSTLDLIPRDYLEWLLKQKFLRAELKAILVSFLYSAGKPLMSRPLTAKPRQSDWDEADEPAAQYPVPRVSHIPLPPWL
jgi:uncharacterized protein (DUF3820 family)